MHTITNWPASGACLRTPPRLNGPHASRTQCPELLLGASQFCQNCTYQFSMSQFCMVAVVRIPTPIAAGVVWWAVSYAYLFSTNFRTNFCTTFTTDLLDETVRVFIVVITSSCTNSCEVAPSRVSIVVFVPSSFPRVVVVVVSLLVQSALPETVIPSVTALTACVLPLRGTAPVRR